MWGPARPPVRVLLPKPAPRPAFSAADLLSLQRALCSLHMASMVCILHQACVGIFINSPLSALLFHCGTRPASLTLSCHDTLPPSCCYSVILSPLLCSIRAMCRLCLWHSLGHFHGALQPPKPLEICRLRLFLSWLNDP
ncbi:hypothetical protein BKA81DRAFT_357453 [Phyllosticta paracitricarpa]